MDYDKFIKLLRYIAIPLAFVIGYFVGSLPGYIIRSGSPETPINILMEGFGLVIQGMCAGLGSVWCGVYMAPSHKYVVGAILVVGAIVFAIVMLCNFNSWMEWLFYIPMMSGAGVGAIAGTDENSFDSIMSYKSDE